MQNFAINYRKIIMNPPNDSLGVSYYQITYDWLPLSVNLPPLNLFNIMSISDTIWKIEVQFKDNLENESNWETMGRIKYIQWEEVYPIEEWFAEYDAEAETIKINWINPSEVDKVDIDIFKNGISIGSEFNGNMTAINRGTSYNYIGGISGTTENGNIYINCRVRKSEGPGDEHRNSITDSSPASSKSYGGLIGSIYRNVQVTNSHSTTSVTIDSGGNVLAGGLIGYVSSEFNTLTRLEKVHAAGDVLVKNAIGASSTMIDNGCWAGGTSTYTGNPSYSTPSSTDSGSMHGADASTAQLGTQAFWTGLGFSTEVWNFAGIAGRGYPLLANAEGQ